MQMIEILRKYLDSKKRAKECYDEIVSEIHQTLESGNDVNFTNVGKFTVKMMKARKGRNPQTGEQIQIEAKRVVRFKPYKMLREKVNPL